MRGHYKLLEIDQNKIFKKIIDLVTVIILYILVLALLSGSDKYPPADQINSIRDPWGWFWSNSIQCPHNFCSY